MRPALSYRECVHSIEAAIPSPTLSVIRLGPLPVHLYALCIVAGIIVALWLTDRRWKARGGQPNEVGDVAGWAIVFGIVGGRLYHVITDPELYFTRGKHPLDALKIWDGGLGIWGAVALGGLGVWIGCRRHRMNFVAFADAAAPGIVIAQALGRWGNWFNNELYGRATTLPWKLQIHDLDVVTGKAARDPAGKVIVLGYYQPTFLYEMLWNLAVGGLLLVLDRRRKLRRGQVFTLYVMAYTVGRFWVEGLREDHANHILGMRVNSWVSILVFLGAMALFLRQRSAPRSTAQDGGLGSPDSDAVVPGHLDSGHAEHESEAAESDRTAVDSGEPAVESAGRHSQPSGSREEPVAESTPPSDR
ncbi:MAG: prolipoprotein diacylglyceryl transferase [Actinomycetota bacterium]|nr:prolipoprotein diacylglyceryl transferase [Actinomycetota bacterium]MDQ2955898.1 prolipoprotein diacylglyceryl transferase [Actinomycetota bacterium]